MEGNIRRFEGCDEMIDKFCNVSTNQVDMAPLHAFPSLFPPCILPFLSNPFIETLNLPGCVLYVCTAFKGVFHKCSISNLVFHRVGGLERDSCQKSLVKSKEAEAEIF